MSTTQTRALRVPVAPVEAQASGTLIAGRFHCFRIKRGRYGGAQNEFENNVEKIQRDVYSLYEQDDARRRGATDPSDQGPPSDGI